MSYKKNCTKGPVELTESGDQLEVMQVDGASIAHVFEGETNEAEANASLISEAFNVLHETGFTPRELADRLKAINDGLNSCENVDDLRDAAAMSIVQSTFETTKG